VASLIAAASLMQEASSKYYPREIWTVVARRCQFGGTKLHAYFALAQHVRIFS
jgi:hypothetical protein